VSDEHWTEVYELWTHVDNHAAGLVYDVRQAWPEFAEAMDRVVDHCANGPS
jgi:hypothetical protein